MNRPLDVLDLNRIGEAIKDVESRTLARYADKRGYVTVLDLDGDPHELMMNDGGTVEPRDRAEELVRELDRMGFSIVRSGS